MPYLQNFSHNKYAVCFHATKPLKGDSRHCLNFSVLFLQLPHLSGKSATVAVAAAPPVGMPTPSPSCSCQKVWRRKAPPYPSEVSRRQKNPQLLG